MLLGRLKPGVTVSQAQKQVDAISTLLQKEYPDSNRNKALLLTGLQEALAEGDRPNLLILTAAVGVLLLVACADVAGLLLSRGAARQAVGLVLGLAGAFGAGRWLRRHLFNVPSTDVVTFVTVVVCLATAAVVACLVPAWRAMHVDPIVALRAE
jgi:hypothetical protein